MFDFCRAAHSVETAPSYCGRLISMAERSISGGHFYDDRSLDPVRLARYVETEARKPT